LGDGFAAAKSEQDAKNLRVVPSHGRNASSESVNSSRSSHSRPSSVSCGGMVQSHLIMPRLHC
jgi:hypothetical protein